jgi:hypothetical protein
MRNADQLELIHFEQFLRRLQVCGQPGRETG